MFAWAGARPLTYDPAVPTGKKSREIKDLGSEGAENILAMTGGPIMTYRSAGTELAAQVAARRAPSGKPRPAQTASRLPAKAQAHARGAAESEHVATLADLMFRRIGIGWNKDMGAADIHRIASEVGPTLGWDAVRTRAEIDGYFAQLREHHAFHWPTEHSPQS